LFCFVATRQLEALFNLSQLLFGLARGEQSNYTFRDLQLGHSARSFRDAGFRKFRKSNQSRTNFHSHRISDRTFSEYKSIDRLFCHFSACCQ